MNDPRPTEAATRRGRFGCWWSRNDMGNVIACYLIMAVCLLMVLAAVGWTP